jgi:O-antigen ligase
MHAVRGAGGLYPLTIDALVFALVVFAACAWGANEPWAIAVVGMGAIALLAARAVGDLWRRGLRLPSPSVWMPGAAFLIYIAFQWLFRSVEPYTTGLYFLIALSFASVVYLAATGPLSRKAVRRLAAAVLIFGVLEALYGLTQYLGGYNYIWNYRRAFSQGVATGTFINRNHYALLLNLCIASSLGYLYYWTDRLLQSGKFSLRRIAGLPGSGKLMWFLFWIALMGLALVFSMSRTGIAAMFCAIAAMMAVAKSVSSKRRIAVTGSLLLVFILGLALYTGIDEVIARYESVSKQWQSDRDRSALWRDAWPLVKKNPFFGSGFGTFQWTYPAYESVQPDVPARYAHNDYLQALAEVGIAGLALLLWMFGSVLRVAYRNFKYSQDPLVRGIGLGTVGVLTALAVQEITDFGLYIPGVAIAAAFLIGVNLRARELERHNL